MGAPYNQIVGVGADFYRWVVQMLRNPNYRRLRFNSRKKVRIHGLKTKKTVRARRSPKFRLRWISPVALLTKLRDAYVNMMLAGSARMTSPSLVSSNFALGFSNRQFGEHQAKEYDVKTLIDLYKSPSHTEQAASKAQATITLQASTSSGIGSRSSSGYRSSLSTVEEM